MYLKDLHTILGLARPEDLPGGGFIKNGYILIFL